MCQDARLCKLTPCVRSALSLSVWRARAALKMGESWVDILGLKKGLSTWEPTLPSWPDLKRMAPDRREEEWVSRTRSDSQQRERTTDIKH
jgi:hypothetical protein